MAVPKAFQTYAEFEREVLRANQRIGLSVEDIMDDDGFDTEMELDFEMDEDNADSY